MKYKGRRKVTGNYLTIVVGVLFIVLGALDPAHAAQFTDFGPYKGKVVDYETKEPIQGAVVNVRWRKLDPFGDHKFMDAQETKTDKEGNFEILGLSVFSPWTRLTSDVNMIIFKSKYQVVDTWAWRKWKQMAPELQWVWKLDEAGPVFLLKKLDNYSERWDSVGDAERRRNYPEIPSDKKILLMEEIRKEKQLLKKYHPRQK